MITAYVLSNGRLEKGSLGPGGAPPDGAVWIDLLSPTKDEEAIVQKSLGIEVPTREEMQEIEVSSRLYREGDAHYMTAPIIHSTDTVRPEASPITFILTPSAMLTVRYTSPKSLDFFTARSARQAGWCTAADSVLMGLFETIVDRVADVMERVAADLDNLSRRIFYGTSQPNGGFERTEEQINLALQESLRELGRLGDLTSKTRDTTLGLDRIATYLGAADALGTRKDAKARLKTLSRDIRSLGEHDGFLSMKVNFLLDATLGMITIEQNKISIEQNRQMHKQNDIIKIFTVAATAFLPPTLVASIYGMNFKWLPELQWEYGYFWALVLMVVSAVVPFMYFKHRGWL